MEHHSFAVSATIYDHKTSLIKWWSLEAGEQKSHSCWSNINWNHLSGFHQFQVDHHRYIFMLFAVNSSSQTLETRGQDEKSLGLPKQLPAPGSGGARYLMTEGDEDNEGAMNFIEAIHELYDHQKKALRNSYLTRLVEQRKRTRQLQLHPPKPKDMVIKFWRRDVSFTGEVEKSKKR